jgi:hypothetical protein
MKSRNAKVRASYIPDMDGGTLNAKLLASFVFFKRCF